MTPLMRRTVVGAALVVGLALAAFGGRLAGEAREPARFGASRFASGEAERAARTACASRAPFVVLDTFGRIKPVNIDDVPSASGEAGEDRLQHGDIVAAIVEASHPGALAYQTDPIFSVATLAGDFGRLAADIEAGRIARPAAVVSSIVLPVDLGELTARTRPDRPFSGDGAVRRRAEILAALTERGDPKNPYAEIDRQLRRLRAAGVPLFVAAGNTGPDETVNALALSEGVFAVGALDRDGSQTAYTSAPGMVSVWSPGFVVIGEAPGGLSISGGRAVELEGADLPDQRAVIAEISGRPAKDLVRHVPPQVRYLGTLAPSRRRNHSLAMMLQPGLYRTQELMAAYGYAPTLGTFTRAVAEGPYMHYPSDTIFRADAQGLLRFDPRGDGTPGQLQVADATSFAAPNLCAAELFPASAETRTSRAM